MPDGFRLPSSKGNKEHDQGLLVVFGSAFLYTSVSFFCAVNFSFLMVKEDGHSKHLKVKSLHISNNGSSN